MCENILDHLAKSRLCLSVNTRYIEGAPLSTVQLPSLSSQRLHSFRSENNIPLDAHGRKAQCLPACTALWIGLRFVLNLQWIGQKYRKKRAKIIRKIIRKLSAAEAVGKKIYVYTKVMSWLDPGYFPKPLVEYAVASKPIKQLSPPCEYLSEAPRLMGAVANRHQATMPAILGRMFSHACVNANSSAILMQQNIAIPRLYIKHPNAIITDHEFFLSQEHGRGTAHCPNPQALTSGIAVFGSGSANWYHWLIEILPAAFLAEGLPKEYASFPLMIPEHCGAVGTFRDAAALFATNRARVLMPAETPFRVGKLIAIDPAVIGPMNLRASQWPEVADYSQNAEVLLAYRVAILERLELAPAPPTRRIFLARSNDRRSFNQAELIGISERYGFEVVYPERMTFREQVQMYAEAEIVLGASGAAFANILFCQRGTRSLTWVLPQYAGFCAYSNLANVVGVTLNYLFVTPLIPINSSFDAYGASYMLAPLEFEAELKQII